MLDLTGKIIDKYKLVRLIGKGGMGAVYEAQHTLVKKKCAVKLLHANLSENDEMVQRMLREAQAAAAIGHHNIVETLDFGATSENICYLVMEYLEGESLGDVLKSKGIMEVGEAVEILIQVLQALQAAHSAGIVHRDLKPENIYIAKGRRGEREIKILDFGISKMLAEDDLGSNLTKTGTVMGTPHYMSPEQAEGAERVTAQTDLWAAGVMLFKMLTGRLPFEGTNYNQVIMKIVIEPPPPLRSLRPDLSEELERILLKSMKRNLEERFQTAADMVEALAPFQQDNDVAPADWSVKDKLANKMGVAISPQPAVVPAIEPTDATAFAPTVAPAVAPNVDPPPALLPDGATGPGNKGFPGYAQNVHEGVEDGAKPIMVTAPGDLPPKKADVPVRDPKKSFSIGVWVGGGAFAVLALAVVMFFVFAGKQSVKSDGPERVADEVSGKAELDDDGDESAGETKSQDEVIAEDAKSNGSEKFRVTSFPVEPRIVEIQLEGLPEGAEVYVDNEREDSPLKIVTNGRTRILEVQAEGFEAFRHSFVAQEGVDHIEVSMKKIARKHPRTAKIRRPVEAKAGTTKPVDTESQKAKVKKAKITRAEDGTIDSPHD